MKAQKNTTKASKNGNPYMSGGLRAAIFTLGAKGYTSRTELAKAVAKQVRTSADKAGFQVAVVCNPAHPGQNNGKQGGKGKSKEIVKGDKRFLVAV